MRRTKIIATMGPATTDEDMLEKLFRENVDVFRLNYSHQTHAEHQECAERIRALSKKHHRAVAIIADLQGPKIRIEHFHEGKVQLREGSTFTIDTDLDTDAGNEKQVGVSYKSLPSDVRCGDTLVLDDGRIALLVQSIDDHEVSCEVLTGGELSDNKGLNLRGGGISAAALTEKDRKDLVHAVDIGVDYIALSFTRNAQDVLQAKEMIREHGGKNCRVIAKIERKEALDNVEEIIAASDAIMIARGDLGVEIGDAALPPVQKRLITLARDMDRVVITATQMMESMIDHQMPTRAEVFDVANAVLDGTDAVMLSAETSVGQNPDKAVRHMSSICEETEKQRVVRTSHHRINQSFEQIDEAIAMSTMYAANHSGARAIVAVTETGRTCLWMSRISSGLPIYAFTNNEETRRRVTLYRGVYPVSFDIKSIEVGIGLVDDAIISMLREKRLLDDGDLVIITKGGLGMRGTTNKMKIVKVGSRPDPHTS